MGIEFVIVFIMFLSYITATEIRLSIKDKRFNIERKALIKSLLDEADVRKAQDMQDRELDKYYDLERSKAIYGQKPDLREKVIYEEEENVGSHEKVFQDMNEKIEEYVSK